MEMPPAPMRGSMEVLLLEDWVLEAVPVALAVLVFVFVPVISLSLAGSVADSVAEAVSESVAVAEASVVEAASPVTASAVVVSEELAYVDIQNTVRLTISSCYLPRIPLITSNHPQQHAQHTEKHKEPHIDRPVNHRSTVSTMRYPGIGQDQ